MAAPAITIAKNTNGDLILTDTAATSTATTPASLTLLAPHRWAGTNEHAQVLCDMLKLALAWLQGRHVDQATLTSGNKAALTLGAGQTTLYPNAANNPNQ